MNLVVANLKARIIKLLTEQGPRPFTQIARALRIRDEGRLDYALQDLRRTRQIYFINPKKGWVIGFGSTYTPMQRRRTRRIK